MHKWDDKGTNVKKCFGNITRVKNKASYNTRFLICARLSESFMEGFFLCGGDGNTIEISDGSSAIRTRLVGEFKDLYFMGELKK